MGTGRTAMRTAEVVDFIEITAAAKLAIQIAVELLDTEDTSWREVPIVLTSDGRLSEVDPDVLFLGGAGSVATE